MKRLTVWATSLLFGASCQFPVSDPYRNAPGPKTQQPLVVLVGDSRVRAWGQPSIPGYEVLNRGIDGERAVAMVDRIDRDVLQWRPRWVVIQTGVNDLVPLGALPHQQDETIANVLAAMRSACDRLVQADCKVILMTILPASELRTRRSKSWGEPSEVALAKINLELLKANWPGVSVVDAGAWLECNRGALPSRWASDHVHINEAAYDRLTERLQLTLTK